MLQKRFLVGTYLGVIEIKNSTLAEIKNILKQLVHSSLPNIQQFADTVPEKSIEKVDQYLAEYLLLLSYGVRAFDIEETPK